MKTLILFLFLICFSFSQSFEEFEKRLDSIKSIKVAFVQKVQYPWQSKADVSKGIFYAQRGGRFRIEYKHPEKTLIVSDSIKILVYSPKDKTAFVDNLDRNNSPVIEALFLVSRPIAEVFQLLGEVEKAEGKVFILKPKVKDEYFSKVFVEVSQRGDIKSIKVEEKEGISTTVEFVRVSFNFTPSEDLFRVKVPEGTKVLKP